MVSTPHLRLKAADRSYHALVKKEIHALAVTTGFKDKRLGELDIVVAELLSNLNKHAKDGELLVAAHHAGGIPGLEITCLDRGPGITDLNRMMQDGSSTKNSLGQGLGAIKRLSDHFHIYTQRVWGTIIVCRLFIEPLPDRWLQSAAEIKGILVAKPGETACGDGYAYKFTSTGFQIFVGDGLGHGPEAAVAVRQAIKYFTLSTHESPADILRDLHVNVKRTRGLVATIASFNFPTRQWKICGVGNIFSKFECPSSSKNHVSHNGIVGLNIPSLLKDQSVNFEPGQILILASDGLRTRWDLGRYPGIFRQDLSILNAALFKDSARETDDMSVIACKPMI